MSGHEHTGWGPDNKSDCEGCSDEYWDEVNRAMEEQVAYGKALDEAEEKLAYLAAGCLKMTRDELIQKITEIGSARWKAGSWLAERTEAAFQRGVTLRKEEPTKKEPNES